MQCPGCSILPHRVVLFPPNASNWSPESELISFNYRGFCLCDRKGYMCVNQKVILFWYLEVSAKLWPTGTLFWCSASLRCQLGWWGRASSSNIWEGLWEARSHGSLCGRVRWMRRSSPRNVGGIQKRGAGWIIDCAVWRRCSAVVSQHRWSAGCGLEKRHSCSWSATQSKVAHKWVEKDAM